VVALSAKSSAAFSREYRVTKSGKSPTTRTPLCIGDMDHQGTPEPYRADRRRRHATFNRIRTTLRQVGMAQRDVLACTRSEVDPYVEQVSLTEGYGDSAEREPAALDLEMSVGELDELIVKALIGRGASASRTSPNADSVTLTNGSRCCDLERCESDSGATCARVSRPLIMVTDIAERSLVDVERCDLGYARPFNGRVKGITFNNLAEGALASTDEQRLGMKIVGPRNVNVRMLTSALRVHNELAGMPQLASAASTGTVLADVVARALLVQDPLRSGSYVLSPRRMLILGRQAAIVEAVQVLRAPRRQLAAP